MIQTVTQLISKEDLGIVLPHEHILVGFIEDGKLTSQDYDRDDVVRVMLPYLKQLADAGCRALVDCGPEYLGRDPYILKELSQLSSMHIITNTGFYQGPYLPSFVYEISVEELADIWIKEAEEGIGESGVKPGFIKIALSNSNRRILPIQQKILSAAIRTSKQTGLTIQAHTIGGLTILHALEIIQENDFDPSKFIWVHADSELDLAYHERAVKAGMWIEMDSIGARAYLEHYGIIKNLIDRGLEDKILISQDAGWYNVGQKDGGQVRPYHLLFTEFIPLLLEKGIDEVIIDKLLVKNPASALNIR